LDEVLEFKPHVLQSLRVPLETGTVSVSRAGRSAVYPARFVLLAAANPCPCGNFGSRGKICLCSPRAVEQYWKKFSGPLLDRIDIRAPVFHPQDRGEKEPRYSAGTMGTAELRRDIARAAAAQRSRQGGYNGAMGPEDIRRHCALDRDAADALEEACLLYGFSSRGASSCRKVARTIADMAGSPVITRDHIAEAVFFRKSEGALAYDGGWDYTADRH
jgi:magnesium chelatase family protein